MYKYNVVKPTKIRVNKSVEGETIEMKMRRIVDNKEPITDGAPLIYGAKGVSKLLPFAESTAMVFITPGLVLEIV